MAHLRKIKGDVEASIGYQDELHLRYGRDIPTDHRRHTRVNLDIKSEEPESKIYKQTKRPWCIN